ncbi:MULTISPECIES: hypothetical protein [Arthrobacter]|uniref:Uncharacterized protein n=1 Tax=Arthrobacter terricola TaxID=2547396 RepID=A0A4R5KJ93_9MICC|nr:MULTISPECIES: hypothetical protein [Arthrobacter]MBT8161424.1 hypothetical protein [Arthrobacter sp. GN70]TDF95599.1 hypothetical protein E1809_11270 [Arthrobacter terricola]
MTVMEKSGQEVRRERCITELRELCKGEGLEAETINGSPSDSPEMRRIFDYFEFDLKDAPRFIKLWMDSLPTDSVFTEAFFNALFADEGLNLTDRREKFLTKHGDISARTLMRYEIEGASIVVRHLEMAEDTLRREKEFQESEDAARDLDIATLRSRITDLETLVVQLLDEKMSHTPMRPDDMHKAWRNVKGRFDARGGVVRGE